MGEILSDLGLPKDFYDLPYMDEEKGINDSDIL